MAFASVYPLVSARAVARPVHLRGAGRRGEGSGRLGAVRALDASAASSSRPGSRRRRASRRRPSAACWTSCRLRSSTSRSGSPSTTARRRPARSSSSRRATRPAARRAREPAAPGLAGEPAPDRLTPEQEAAVAAIVGAMDARRRPLPALRRDRQRQDRGLPPGLRGRARARARRDRARARDRAHAAGGRPLPGPLRRRGSRCSTRG